MDSYSCIIIEDEPLALERTKSFVDKIPFLHLCGTFENALDGLAYLKSNKVDLLFLDINMKTGHGGASGRFESLKEVAKEFAFLFNLENITK